MSVQTLWQRTEVVPDLGNYDIIFINTSAGKDSQAMLDRIVELADAADVPRSRLVCFHADLGRVEWEGTPELAEEHADHYGLRFVKQARPQGDLLDHIEAHGKFPNNANRFCTSDHKRGQGRVVLTKLVKELERGRGYFRHADGTINRRPVRILACMGFRRQESPARAKKVPFRFDDKASNGRRHVDEWCPILEWTVEQVWARNAQAGTRHHWAYDAGMPRLSCSFCVLAGRDALIRAAQLRPALAQEYAAVEVRIGHIFRGKPGTRSALSMADIIAAAQSETVTTISDWNA